MKLITASRDREEGGTVCGTVLLLLRPSGRFLLLLRSSGGVLLLLSPSGKVLLLLRPSDGVLLLLRAGLGRGGCGSYAPRRGWTGGTRPAGDRGLVDVGGDGGCYLSNLRLNRTQS